MDGNAPVTRGELKTELATALGASEKRVVERIIEYAGERTRDLQTELLRAFADYSNSANVRFRKLEADSSNIDTSTTQRLGEIERQMTDFKLRLIALEGQR
ncbi:MAG: hypothetical protein ACRD4O_14505 [Bryobacteraceae bacterium]